jgi:streptomycin 6-kinase
VIVIPGGLLAAASRGPEWARWLDVLPRKASELIERWNLSPTGESFYGYCSLVLAVVRDDGTPAMLKITVDGDDESRDEHLVLRRWAGNAAVRMLAAEPSQRALLLERLTQDNLDQTWDIEACQIVCGLYEALHVPPMPGLQNLADYIHLWADALRADRDEVPIPRRLVDRALALARDLTAEPASAVVHGDLHYQNVLRGQRDGEDCWLAIDPKPMNGWPAYDVEPLLRNRYDEYGEAVSWGVRNRMAAIVDASGLPHEQVRDWVVLRSIIGAHWAFADAKRGRRDMTDDEREDVTRRIAVAKAAQA